MLRTPAQADRRCEGIAPSWLIRVGLFLVAGLLVFPDSSFAQNGDGPTPQPITIEGDVNELDEGDDAGKKKQQEPTGIPTHPVEIIRQMSGWLVPFVIASVISVWFAIERVVVLRKSRVIPPEFVDAFMAGLEKGQMDSATAATICEKNDSPTAAVFAHAVFKWGRPSVEVEQAVIDGGERQVAQLRRHLRVLNGVATVTPLLGLLGTVVGMIQAFNDIASAGAMGRPDQLATGIAMALLTTAFGLTIAIPSLIVYMYLSGRVESLVMEMDELSLRVVRFVSAEGLESRKSAQPSMRMRPTVRPKPSEAVT